MHEVGIDSDKHLSDEPCDLFILFILLMKLFKKKGELLHIYHEHGGTFFIS